MQDEAYLLGNYDASRTVHRLLLRFLSSCTCKDVAVLEHMHAAVELTNSQLSSSEDALEEFYKKEFGRGSSSNT